MPRTGLTYSPLIEYARLALQVIVGLGLLNVWLLRFGKATPYRGSSAETMHQEFAVYGLPTAVLWKGKRGPCSVFSSDATMAETIERCFCSGAILAPYLLSKRAVRVQPSAISLKLRGCSPCISDRLRRPWSTARAGSGHRCHSTKWLPMTDG